MKYSELVRESVASMSGYQPGEQPSGGEIVKLNTNENPYPPSSAVIEAIKHEAGRQLALYPSPGADALIEQAVSCYGEFGVQAEGIIAGNGSDELLSMLLKACVEPGEVVSFGEPTYSLYRSLAMIAGARIESADVEPGSVPESPFGENARLTFLCTPNSPFGNQIPLGTIADTASRSRGVVVVDEAYVDFGGSTALALLADHANLVVTRTFSKSFSLAGLRLGLAFMAPGLAREIRKVKDSYNVSRLSIAAGVAALSQYGYMLANAEKIISTRRRVKRVLEDRGWWVSDSSANFLWARPPSGDGKKVFERLRERGVLVRWFNTDGLRDGIRVTIGDDEQMDRFLSAAKHAVADTKD